ncbi:MAG: FAD-dependent oxidoreductase [Candidatus Omnitrophota bacterium]
MVKIVIIGNSAAGFSVLENLIRELPEKQLTVVSREGYPAYRRNLLIDYFSGKTKEEDIFLCTEEFYKRKGVIFHANSEVERIDTRRCKVVLKNKSRIDYDYLVIASGNKVNIPDIPGKNKEGSFAFCYLEEIKGIKNKLMLADTVCVTGEIKLCVSLAEAISFKYPNKEIKIITKENNASLLSEGKIELLTGVSVQELIGEGGLQAIKLDSGKIIASSLLLFAGDYQASSGFLKDTEINNDSGYIITDENMRTNLDNVFACGSVAKNNNDLSKDKLWKDCIEEGGIAASSIIKLIEKRNIVYSKV